MKISKLTQGTVLCVIRLFNCAERNTTRHKPNITAKQYNSPKANITEKLFLNSQKEFFW